MNRSRLVSLVRVRADGLLRVAQGRRKRIVRPPPRTPHTRRWFGDDRDYPAGWEPSGANFLSAALTEAELMASVGERFLEWFDTFPPELPNSLLKPAVVSDSADGQIAHLHGLNLSRAWCWRHISEAPQDDPADRDDHGGGRTTRRGGAPARGRLQLPGRALTYLLRPPALHLVGDAPRRCRVWLKVPLPKARILLGATAKTSA
jgi:Protein of unknown function (DUF2891)